MAQVHRPGATSAILGNASYFFEPFDKPLAEQLLLRSRAIDPNGPWAARLGRFYALVLAGREVPAGQSSIRTVASPEPNSPFGVAVRRMLAQSTDDVLLTATGWFLVRSQSTLREWNGIHAGAWAKTCFERALWLNPDAVLAHAELLNVSYSQRLRRAYESTLWAPAPIALSSSIAALPEGERFAKLPALARNAYTALEDMARWNDPNLRDRMALERYHAEAFARETLELAERHRSDPQYGTAVYTANMVLGALTLRDGDRSAASAFLLNASKAPPTEELAYREDVVSGVHWHLARDLLERGERDAVAQFLDRMAQINVVRRLELRDAAAAIRRGETPKLAW
jgi:hypothetical protein